MLKLRPFLHAEKKKRCAAADSDEELIPMRACEIVCVFCGPKGILVVPVVSYHILLGDVFKAIVDHVSTRKKLKRYVELEGSHADYQLRDAINP